MSKFSKASDEIQNMVAQIAQDLMLDNYMEFEAIHCPKAKEVVTVSKASATAEYLSQREDLILVIIREDAFDRLGNDANANNTKKLWLRKEMERIETKINDNTGEMKININTTDLISVPIPFYDRYKDEAVNSALLAKYTLAQIEDEEKERKEQAKAAKKGKRKKQEE